VHLVGFYYLNNTSAGPNFIHWYLVVRRPGWLNRYSVLLQAGYSGDLIPVGTIFPAPVQTGPRAHPASYTVGTGSFPLVRRPGRGVDHPPLHSAEVKKRVKLYLYHSSGPSWPVLECTLHFISVVVFRIIF
jgi:hypothetical protein